jgi:hypothetical protein
MAKQNEHGKLIAAAAKAALLPLGCRRKGQSRCWFSDERFWCIFIEFQPSGWSKGSYLNAAATWLWHTHPFWTFDGTYHPPRNGYRVPGAGFIDFQSAEQFTPLIAEMAALAAREVIALREKFKSFDLIYEHLLGRAVRDGIPVYHAAVAAGLVGDITSARQLFRRLEEWCTDGYGHQLQLKANSAELAQLIEEPARFRAAVLANIENRRRCLCLPPDPQCLNSWTRRRSTD